ncbi:heterokaryon incompatibility protein-domain-containing protein [Xylaria sp. FL0043]|nr:heterokaryon incompatibility protein-domain-containing protein [Xylaria sp. FL0043]
METYTYAPLDLNEPSFRLIRLFPGVGQQLQCELIHASLAPGEMMDYEAVSYTWGSVPRDIFFIEIHGERAGKLSIGYNLFRLLLSLRDPVVDRILWIDAICINQDEGDATERNHQVQQMARIYRGAQRVLVWLGPPTDEMILAMILLKKMQKLCKDTKRKVEEIQESDWRDLQYSDSRDHYNPTHLGLEQIFNHPWFRRIWILQEVGNARTALIHCGKHAVSSSIFCQAPSALKIRLDSYRQAVLDLMPGSQVRLKEGSSPRDLRTLLEYFREAQATREHDHIYALLGLCSEEDNCLRVSYEKPMSTVISEVISLICHYEVPSGPKPLYSSLREFQMDLKQLDEKVLEKLAIHGYTDSLKCAFERLGTNITVTETLMLAAVRNRQKAREIFDIYIQKVGKLDVTEAVLQEAAEHGYQGKEILATLLSRAKSSAITEEVILAAIENNSYDIEIHGLVLSQVKEMILAAARGEARGEARGQGILDVVLSRTGKRLLTESLAVKAAVSPDISTKALNVLLSRAKIPFTKRSVMAAIDNWSTAQDKKILRAILAKAEEFTLNEVELIHAIQIVGADAGLIGPILERAQNLPLSEDVLLTVIRYCGYHGGCLHIALKRAGKSTNIARTPAAAIPHYDAKALDMVPQGIERPAAVVEEVLLAAVCNRNISTKLFDILFQRLGEVWITERVMVAALDRDIKLSYDTPTHTYISGHLLQRCQPIKITRAAILGLKDLSRRRLRDFGTFKLNPLESAPEEVSEAPLRSWNYRPERNESYRSEVLLLQFLLAQDLEVQFDSDSARDVYKHLQLPNIEDLDKLEAAFAERGEPGPKRRKTADGSPEHVCRLVFVYPNDVKVNCNVAWQDILSLSVRYYVDCPSGVAELLWAYTLGLSSGTAGAGGAVSSSMGQ